MPWQLCLYFISILVTFAVMGFLAWYAWRQRKRAEESLQRAEQCYRTLFEEAPAMYVITRNVGGAPVIADCNEPFCRTLGFSYDELMGRPLADFYSPASRAEMLEGGGYQRALIGSTENEGRELVTRDGRIVSSVVQAMPEVDATGQVSGTRATYLVITERKRAEDALRESESSLQGILQSTADGILAVNRDNKVLFANERFVEMWMIPQEVMASKDDSVLLQCVLDQLIDPPSFLQKVQELYKSNQESFDTLYFKDGRVFDRLSRPLTQGTELRGRVWSFRDITERKRVEEALRESEERYRAVTLSANEAIITIDGAGSIVGWNRGAERIFGYTEAEVSGQPLTRLMPHRYHDGHLAGMVRVQAGGERRVIGKTVELEGRRKDGSEFPLELALAEWNIATGRFYTGIIRDITKRKRAEESLRESEEWFRALADTTSTGIFIYQGERFVYVNRANGMLSGYTAEEFLALRFWDLIHPDSRELVRERGLARQRGEPVPDRYEVKIVRKDGEDRWIDFTAGQIDWKGQPAVLGTAFDITERKRAEEALRRLNAELEQRVEERTRELSLANLDLTRAVRLKDEFLANMSHELHTPLNGILGLSEALQEGVYGPLTPKQMHSLQTIESSGRHLLALISDILDLSKIGAGKLDVRMGPVSVKSVCQASLRCVEPAAQKKRLTLTSQLDEQVESLQADKRRLKQILVNLLANAVKFTPEGGAVGLEVTASASPEGVREVRFTVWDTGIGIAPENIARLFQPFTQLDTGLARRYEGAGLGLALVARLVELHGGRVWVESPSVSPPHAATREAGRTKGGPGSRFSVAIPWQAVGQETRKPVDLE